MPRKENMDAFGAAALIAFAFLFGVNQVTIKLVNDGLQPVFAAGLRSLGAIPCIWLWMAWNGRRVRFEPGTRAAGLLLGLLFSFEFVCLFMALDLTTVSRSSVIFYSMPIWLALGAHLMIPGDRITPRKALGLALAFAGVALAFADRGANGAGYSLAGDLFALGGAVGWAALALCARVSAISRVRPEMQLMWQVLVSAPVLLLLAPAFGPLVRDLTAAHVAGLTFQIVFVVTLGFIGWLWLLSVYPASSVASFSFLIPIVSLFLGWQVLGEQVGPSLLAACALVAVGIVLINRAPRPAPG